MIDDKHDYIHEMIGLLLNVPRNMIIVKRKEYRMKYEWDADNERVD